MIPLTFEKLPSIVFELRQEIKDLKELVIENSSNNLNLLNDQKPMSIKEAAEFIKLSVPTLYNKVSKREIPYSKKGKHLYFFKAELRAWIKNEMPNNFSKMKDITNEYLLNKKRASYEK